MKPLMGRYRDWEGSFHCGEVASWLHGNFKAVEEILRDDRSGLVVNHVEAPVDFRKHVNDAGPFDVDRDCSSVKINRFFLFSRISKCSKWGRQFYQVSDSEVEDIKFPKSAKYEDMGFFFEADDVIEDSDKQAGK